MAKAPTLPTLVGGYESAAAINANFQAILTSLQNTVSRDGSAPNQMQADLDLNGNGIVNVGTFSVEDVEVDGRSLSSILNELQAAITTLSNVEGIDTELQETLTQVQALVSQVAATEAALGQWRGTWETGTNYVVGDRVEESGSSYICTIAHTSEIFFSDLTANRWNLFAQKGLDGLGSGDLVAANNLSDVANVATARANLLAQTLNSLLTAISGLAANGLIARTSASTASTRTITGTANQITVTNGDGVAGNPTIAAVVASQAEAETGTDNTRLMTPLRVKQAIDEFAPPGVGAPLFTGEDTTWYNTRSVFTHGLGRHPYLVRYYLQCTTAAFGYSVGDRIELGPGDSYNGDWNGILAWTSTTEIGAHVSVVTIREKVASTSRLFLTSNSNFKLVVEVW